MVGLGFSFDFRREVGVVGDSKSVNSEDGDDSDWAGSSMTRRESIHVGGLCSRSVREMCHDPGVSWLCCRAEATKNDKRHKRPDEDHT
jgi:hypothetical protein